MSRVETRALDQHGELYIIGLVLDSHTVYLGEIVQRVKNNFGVDISAATVCRLLKRYGHTRKKVRQVAQQRCALLRGHFIACSTPNHLCGLTKRAVIEGITFVSMAMH